jgi:serine/threonine protein kinase
MSVLPIGQQINVGQQPLLVQKELGSGAFGTVYMVSDLQQLRAYYALKAVVCKDSSSVSTVKREVNTLAKARHERIVQILAADSYTLSNSDSLFLILTEFCSGGDLNSQLNSTSTPETNLKWISQISEALSYLHSLNPPIVHRDLKADNVLLTDQWSQDLKLGDFGLAREYLAMNNNDGSPQSAQTYYMTSGCGPMHWMAPEFFLNHYTEKADVFSLGGIFYAILIRDSIQVGGKNMYGVFLTCSYPNVKVGLGYAMAAINPNAKVSLPASLSGWSIPMLQLIGNMMNYHPHNRPSASQVKASVANIRSSTQAGIFPPNWGYFQPGN